MSPKEKYEIIVAKIEELIKSPEELKDKDIIESAFNAASEYMDDRSKNTIFGFLMHTTVLKYISERRLMAGYRVLLNEREAKKAYKRAYELSGSNTQQAYITKFKDYFGFPPTDAIKLYNDSLYKAVPTWESLSENETEDENMNNRKFGISLDQFKLIQEALNLEAFYDLNDTESDFAFNIYLDKKSSLEESFQFVGSYLMQNDDEDRDVRLKIDLDNADVQYLYFKLGLNFEEIFNVLLMQYLGEFKLGIQEYDEEFIRGCVSYPIESEWTENRKETFEDIYAFYKEKADSKYTKYDFCLFIYYLDYKSKEQAFKSLKPGIDSEKKLKGAKNNFIESLYESEYEASYEEDDGPYYEDSDRYEPEVWDENYSTYLPDEDPDYDSYDEDAWIAREMEEANPIPEEDFEDDDFDVKQFIAICNSMSELTPEEIDNQKKRKRAFVSHKNLDVKSYWEHRADSSSQDEFVFL